MIDAYDPAGKKVLDAIRPDIVCAWLNGTGRGGDVSYFRDWHGKGRLKEWSDLGYDFMLISWENYDGQSLSLGGPTYGDYHLSSRFIGDIKEIATYLKGYKGDIFFALATEFSTYPACRYGNSCTDESSVTVNSDRYNSKTKEYYDRFIPNILTSIDEIKSIIPKSRVGLSFGGWLVTFDEPEYQAGKSLIHLLEPVIEKSDMIFFQSMRDKKTGEDEDIGNPAQIMLNCQFFSKYKKPLGVSHYMPHSKRADVMADDLEIMLKPEWLRAAKSYGLSLFSFMEYGLLKNNEFGVLNKAKEIGRAFKK